MIPHFLRIQDWKKTDLLRMLDRAGQWKANRGLNPTLLAGRAVGLLFQKSSTRTRLSFEVGVGQMGGQPLFLSPRDLQLDRGEPLRDTMRVMNGYLDMLMIRTFDQSVLTGLAEYATIPLINGLTDQYHPCQAMADALTILEKSGLKAGQEPERAPVVCFVGDGNNVACSLMWICVVLGWSFRLVCPPGYELPASEREAAAARVTEQGAGSRPEQIVLDSATSASLGEAVAGADFLYTDVWVSMGQEKNREQKLAAFRDFTLTKEVLTATGKDCRVLHCLPAHRGEEISEELMEDQAATIFRQAENRLHAQKAIMEFLFQNTPGRAAD